MVSKVTVDVHLCNNYSSLTHSSLHTYFVKIKTFYVLHIDRFGNDLLLWQPAAPTPRDHSDSYLSYGIAGGLDMTQIIGANDKFTMCRSAAAFGKFTSMTPQDGQNMHFFMMNNN